MVRWGIVASWQRSARSGRLSKFKEDFFVPRSICCKIFMKIQSVIIILLDVGRCLHSTDGYQNLMDCSFHRLQPLQKFQRNPFSSKILVEVKKEIRVFKLSVK